MLNNKKLWHKKQCSIIRNSDNRTQLGPNTHLEAQLKFHFKTYIRYKLILGLILYTNDLEENKLLAMCNQENVIVLGYQNLFTRYSHIA